MNILFVYERRLYFGVALIRSFMTLYALLQVGFGDGLPASLPDSYEDNEEFLKAAHHALLEVEVVEGELECPETGRKFPITGGIPNMLLQEDEVSN